MKEYDVIIVGGGIHGAGVMQADELPWMNRPYSLALTVPPLAAIVLRPT